jgi:hypothetical protein
LALTYLEAAAMFASKGISKSCYSNQSGGAQVADDMTDEPKSMDQVRTEMTEVIAMAESGRQRLVLWKQDIELFGGNSPAAIEALHKVLETHTVVCEQLQILYQTLAATEPRREPGA